MSAADLDRLRGLRDGDFSLPPHTATVIEPALEGLAMGQLYDYRGIVPTIADSTVPFPAAEVAGTDPPPRPAWSLQLDDLPSPTTGGTTR